MRWAMPTDLGLVIFDCDGVLVDSERINNQVMADVLAECGFRLGYDEVVERFIGHSFAQCLAALREDFGFDLPPDFPARVEHRTRSELERSLVSVPGVESVLSALSALSLPYCVASNGERDGIAFSLRHTGLLPWFGERFFSAQDVAAPKPAPDVFLHAARQCAVDPLRCVVVEDTPTGVKAARAAGMKVLGFAGLTPAARLHAAGAHDVFCAMHELPGLLGIGTGID